jgi:hypothetical protein
MQLLLCSHRVNRNGYLSSIVNDGRYGDLVGKAVSLESATGFTFDTHMAVRP